MKLGRYMRNFWLGTATFALSMLPNYSCSSLRVIESPDADYASRELGVPESGILWLEDGYATTEPAYRIMERVARGRTVKRETDANDWNRNYSHPGMLNNWPENSPEEETRRVVAEADCMIKQDRIITFDEACALSKYERNFGRK